MRDFQDERGTIWTASVQEREGDDYKGRFILRLDPRDGQQDDAVFLRDITWNSSKTAARTLNTMSEVELRRRLKIGLGRDG